MNHGAINAQTASALKNLHARIEKAKVPPSSLDQTLNIATWNIREFGRKRRLESSIHLIAEIIGQFDIVSVVEVRDDLTDLQRVLAILGPTWNAVFNDINTDAAGNRERIAFVYDQRAVTFTGLAAEASPPRKKDPKTGEYLPTMTWWRNPFMASFSAGDYDFILLAAHIPWGGDGAAARVPELQKLADWLEDRRNEKHVEDKDIIVVGDFNIPDQKDATFKAITSRGLRLPLPLLAPAGGFGSNLEKDKRYDQILYYPTAADAKLFTNNGGVLDFYMGDHKALFPGQSMTKAEFTYQLSDHLPLWIQLNTDNDLIKLDQIINKKR